MNEIHLGDNLPILRSMPSASVQLVYTDPPFNTGRRQVRTHLRTIRSEEGDRIGFKGARYQTVRLGSKSFDDVFDDYLSFLEPRLVEIHRILQRDGSLYFHVDYREAHYCKVLLDIIFGRENFINEIIWAYDYGARTRRRWPAKHDNILVYAKCADHFVFNYADIDRIPYMAPSLVGPEKAAKGKLPTDTWWNTIVSPTGKEKTGYPTQKPLAIAKRIVTASSHRGARVLDPFAGSGTLGQAAWELGREFVLIDSSRDAVAVMARRLSAARPRFFGYVPEIENCPQALLSFPEDLSR